MMIDDIATTVVEMYDKTGCTVVESLGAPGISELAFRELQYVTDFQPSFFGKDATSAFTTKCRSTNRSIERVYGMNIATTQDISSFVQASEDASSALCFGFISKRINRQKISWRPTSLKEDDFRLVERTMNILTVPRCRKSSAVRPCAARGSRWAWVNTFGSEAMEDRLVLAERDLSPWHRL